MAALLLAVPTVLTLPADGRPDSALKPQILGDQTEHEATAPDEQAAGSNASARAGWLRERVPDGFTSTETCQEDCYTYAGDWTEKCQWNDRVHCDGCDECGPTAPDTQLEKENEELKKKLEAAEKPQKQQQAAPVPAPSPPRAHDFVNTDRFLSGNDTQQVLADTVPHLRSFALLRVNRTAAHTMMAHVPGPNDTTLLFGLSGSCSVVADAPCPNVTSAKLRRGVAVLVRNGHKHWVHGNCVAATATVASGPWNENELDLAMVPNRCDISAPPVLRVTDTDAIKPEPTAHKSDLLSKRVHLRAGRVPGLLQLSVSKFQPGAVCEGHAHETGTEVYLHYRGRGCHLRATEADGAESEFDLYPHHFDALHPGTKHMAYNLNETSSCENLNMMLADPGEVLPPKSGHKPKPR